MTGKMLERGENVKLAMRFYKSSGQDGNGIFMRTEGASVPCNDGVVGIRRQIYDRRKIQVDTQPRQRRCRCFPIEPCGIKCGRPSHSFRSGRSRKAMLRFQAIVATALLVDADEERYGSCLLIGPGYFFESREGVCAGNVLFKDDN